MNFNLAVNRRDNQQQPHEDEKDEQMVREKIEQKCLKGDSRQVLVYEECKLKDCTQCQTFKAGLSQHISQQLSRTTTTYNHVRKTTREEKQENNEDRTPGETQSAPKENAPRLMQYGIE